VTSGKKNGKDKLKGNGNVRVSSTKERKRSAKATERKRGAKQEQKSLKSGKEQCQKRPEKSAAGEE